MMGKPGRTLRQEAEQLAARQHHEQTIRAWQEVQRTGKAFRRLHPWPWPPRPGWPRTVFMLLAYAVGLAHRRMVDAMLRRRSSRVSAPT